MIKKIILIIVFNFINFSLHANIKEQIIINLQNTDNIAFNFKQLINEKIEKGNCIIEYPKKIFCLYANNKIIVSNGKSLVIKNKNNSYIYRLKSTPLDLILNKQFLINEIKKIDAEYIDDKYYRFKLNKNETKISIFFDKKNLYLVGWQTEDIYQNSVMTFISSVKLNQIIDKRIFKLPKIN